MSLFFWGFLAGTVCGIVLMLLTFRYAAERYDD